MVKVIRKAGRKPKRESEKSIAKNTTYTPENYNYIIKILQERNLSEKGFFSKEKKQKPGILDVKLFLGPQQIDKIEGHQ